MSGLLNVLSQKESCIVSRNLADSDVELLE